MNSVIKKSLVIILGVLSIISCIKEEEIFDADVIINSPTIHEVVNGIIEIEITINSEHTISKVELWVDSLNTELFDDSKPYSIPFNTEEYEDGLLSIFIRAYSTDSDYIDSDAVIIEIDNLPNFEIFDESNSPLSSYGSSFFDVSSNGNLYVGDFTENLYYYDSNQWSIITASDVQKPGWYFVFVITNNDTIWAGLTDHWFSNEYSLVKIYNDTSINYDYNANDIALFVRMIVDNSNNIWITSTYGRILRFNGHDFKTWYYSDHWSDSTHMYYPDDGAIGGLAVDNDNKIWFAGYSNYLGFVLSSYSNGNWEVFEMPGISGGWVAGLVMDNDNNKWISIWNIGLVKFSSNNTWTIYDTTNSDLPSNALFSNYADADNSIWIGSYYDGIINYNQSTNQWSSYNKNNSDQLFSTINQVRGINNIIWAGSHMVQGEPGGLIKITFPK